MAASERSIERALTAAVARAGGLCPKSEKLGRGWPDRVALLPEGRMVFIELKTEAGKLSPSQERVHRALRALGFEVRVPRSRAEVEELTRDL